MEPVRKPFQGVMNIVWFNWPFFLWAGLALCIGIAVSFFLNRNVQPFLYALLFLMSMPVVVSLLVSWYVYDRSPLYTFNWLQPANPAGTMLTIHAGFDETSLILQQTFSPSVFISLDFYDPEKHTEASIRRARKACPPLPFTQAVTTGHLPLADHSADTICLILSAHEIRGEEERIAFFREVKRLLKPGGEVIVTEHLRDAANFVAYTIGFFHFHSKATWLHTFQKAGLRVQQEMKITPFISTFILHGPTT